MAKIHRFIVMYRILLTVAILTVTITASDIDVHLTSPDGTDTKIVGTVDSGDRCAQFLGIRYGTPPTGENRFRKSSMYNYKESTVNSKKHGNVCPQSKTGNSLLSTEDTMDEDCLFLNIFVPLESSATKALPESKKRAVFIFIHGGGFTMGSVNPYSAVHLSVEGDIIFVAVNYRLGYFGFLSTDDGTIPANLGLWDQQLAIQWVHRNIGYFGGDTSRITVGGQSAGSISTILQSTYAENDELFQNIIAESGTPFVMSLVVEKGLPLALKIAKEADCQLEGKEDELGKSIRDCLMKMSAEELVKLAIPPDMLLAPTLDDVFVTKEMVEIAQGTLQQSSIPTNSMPASFTDRNLLTGFTADDGEIIYTLNKNRIASSLPFVFDTAKFVSEPITKDLFNLLVNHLVENDKNKNAGVSGVIADAVIERYVDWTKPSNDTTTLSYSAVNLLTDLYFKVPTINMALSHANANVCKQGKTTTCKQRKTYVYEFVLPFPNSISRILSRPIPWFRGTSHGAELIYLSDLPLRNDPPGMAALMIRCWSNFVKTGNPNDEGSTAWKEFTENSQDLYQLSISPKTLSNPHGPAHHFWNEYLPGLQSKLGAKCPGKANSANELKRVENLFLFCLSALVVFCCQVM